MTIKDCKQFFGSLNRSNKADTDEMNNWKLKTVRVQTGLMVENSSDIYSIFSYIMARGKAQEQPILMFTSSS
jgi:hypothetical protein